MGIARPETHRRPQLAPSFSSDPTATGLTGSDTADEALAALNSTVSNPPVVMAVQTVTWAAGVNSIIVGGAPSRWPRRVTIEGGATRTVATFDGDTVATTVTKLSDPTAVVYGKPFTFVLGGCEITASGDAQGAGDHWEVPTQSRRVTLEF